MSGPDEKDERLKGPLGAGGRTTPYGTPAPAGETTEFTLPTPQMQALAERYEILCELGRGGMGIVYQARDRETGEILALKVLKPEIADRPDLLERFKAELRLARKITHKNVCRVHDLDRFGSVVAITMEYVEGESLRALLNRCETLSVRHGLKLMRQVLGGLAEAHAQGVVHRDLKPENVLIARDGTAKVMDFGIARSLEAGATATTTGMVIGTPAYMSPEQADGKAVDQRTDIYALGLILYEMFTGRRPYETDTPVALALKHIHEAPPSPRFLEPDLPERIDRAILKCLEKNPKKRFQSVQELEAALIRAPEAVPTSLEGEPAEVPLPLHLARWQRRDWALVGLAILGWFVFFSLFDRVFPYAVIQVPMSESEAIKRTQALVQKYSPELKGLEYLAVFEGVNYLPEFPEQVLEVGLSKALQLRRTEVPSLTVVPKKEPRAGGPETLFYASGELGQLSLPEGATPSQAELPWTIEQVLPRATQYAQELFKVKLAGVAPKAFTYDVQGGRWVSQDGSWVGGKNTPVWWVLPGPAETDRNIRLWFIKDRLVHAEQRILPKGSSHPPRLAENREGETPWALAQGLGGWVIFLYLILCLFLYFYRRLYSRTSGVALALSLPMALGAVVVYWAENGPEDFWATVPLLFLLVPVPIVFLLALLVFYAYLSVPFHYIARTLPAHLNTLSDLLRKRLRAPASGLAILRGIAFGVIYLALHVGLLWVMGTFKLGAARTILFSLPGLVSLPYEGTVKVSLSLSLAWPAMIGVFSLLVLGLPLALLRRLTAKPAALLGAATLLWTASAFLLPGATAYPVLPLYIFAVLQGLFFSYLFFRYDALTCMVAVFTMETWLLSYAVYRVFGTVEPSTVSWGLVLWWAVLLSGFVLWMSPQLTATFRRAAAVFE